MAKRAGLALEKSDSLKRRVCPVSAFNAGDLRLGDPGKWAQILKRWMSNCRARTKMRQEK